MFDVGDIVRVESPDSLFAGTVGAVLEALPNCARVGIIGTYTGLYFANVELRLLRKQGEVALSSLGLDNGGNLVSAVADGGNSEDYSI